MREVVRRPLLTPEVGGNVTAELAELLDELVPQGAHCDHQPGRRLSWDRHGPAWGATVARTIGTRTGSLSAPTSRSKLAQPIAGSWPLTNLQDAADPP